MILQQDAALRRLAESRRHLELAGRHVGAIVVRPALELEHLDAVQPVLDAAIGARHDARVLPHIDLGRDADVGHELGARIDVVQRRERAIAVDAEFRVRMPFVVEQSDIRARAARRRRSDRAPRSVDR